MSTYSPDLRIELIANGAQAGTWGTTTNDTWAYVIDPAISGFQTVAVASADQALTYVSGSTATASANQATYASLAFTTSTGANFAVYAPPNPKQYIIWNNSSYQLTIYNSTVLGNTTAAGAGVAIPAGKKVQVFSDGTNFYSVDAANLTGTLAIVNGGTGATTASNARTNLGLVIGTDVPSPTGTGASGTWSISINGNAATATSATSATSATNATNATNVVSGGTIASNVTATTQSVGTNNTTVATTAFVQQNRLNSGTAVTASGTSVDFTGIPSTVKRVFVVLSAVTTDGTSPIACQIGSGSFVTSGYGGTANSGNTYTSATNAAALEAQNAAAAPNQGVVSITTPGSNIWVFSGTNSRSDIAQNGSSAYTLTLSGTLDRVRVTTLAGTDTFTGGTINILYE